MTPHKLFLHLFELSGEDLYLVDDLMNTIRQAREEFKNVGVSLTHETFKQWFQRVYGPIPNPVAGNTTAVKSMHRDYEKMWKMIEGDNLDIIEDAAEKKGLL